MKDTGADHVSAECERRYGSAGGGRLSRMSAHEVLLARFLREKPMLSNGERKQACSCSSL